MSAEPVRLDELLESVADGTPIEWDALERAAAPAQQRLLRHLRVVAAVAQVHRTAAEDETREAGPSWPAAVGEPGDGIPRWGHLLLLEKLGEGGFGEVYRARDPWLDREVALKLLKPDQASQMPGSRIVNEARALARVRHSNVVTVHGADMHDGRVGLWMDLVRGRTLAQIVDSQGPFSASEAAVIGQELCRALAAVHAAGLVHRDIKAQNVMRESGGRLVLMDFGAGHTPLYSAPEVLTGAEATIQTDLYALGVLLYYLVTGTYPMHAAGLEDLKRAHALGERRRLVEQRPDLPEGFVAAVERSLHVDPGQRFATAREMQEALADATTQRRVTSKWDVSVPSDASWRTSPRVIAAAAIVLIAIVAGAVWRSTRPAVTDPAAIQLIAVMPLRAEAADAEYFADGMTEALMQELSGLRTLRVVSRTSVDRAQQLAGTLPEIARALHADAILEGSIYNARDDVRVNLRLIHAGSDTPVWSRSFEEPLRSVFALQSRVARSVAEELAIVIAPAAPASAQSVDPMAYDAYLRGRYELRRRSQVGVEAALSHFQRAASIEPRYARAVSGMAECYLMLGGDFGALPLAEGSRLARESAMRALELDSTLAEAAGVLAEIKFQFDWDFAGADEQFKRAIALDPSLVGPREEYSMFLASRRRFDEAFSQLAAARAVDPLSASVADRTAAVNYYARKFDVALSEAQRAIQLDPNAMSARVGLGRILNALGRHQEAIAQYESTSRESSSDHPFFQSEIAQAEIALGLKERALGRIRTLETQILDPTSRASAYMLALAYVNLDRESAFRWLEQDFERRSSRVLWLQVDPRVDPLRTDPRFEGFVRRLELVP